ncbi:hypothetical protein HDA40_000778 [Hamadaea flava]|uniref:HEAT repeat domain-containing protein n=1 Tax=Hamadaea flava TaxID=1742688 RepID=A0ABV8LRM2_9ACTN|nr:HEAT repeat domain-containing protein [Hamadaea flava]MCP2322271.1 hypothetical protein [Hamadaea flava]
MSNEFRQALRLMRRRNPQLAEDGFHRLRDIAADHIEELIEEFNNERDHGIRCWLLELIGDARSDRALPVLAAELHGDDAALRDWAVRGLQNLDTPESRRLLWRWAQNRAGG